jgi:hypothetical protein
LAPEAFHDYINGALPLKLPNIPLPTAFPKLKFSFGLILETVYDNSTVSKDFA